MKIQTLLSAVLFASVASLSASVSAADADAPKMTPHSHMQEKTGVAPKASAPATDEKADATTPAAKPKKAKKAKDRHLHPRDGK